MSYSGLPLPPSELGYVNEQNRLIGRVLLQQVRVRPDVSCHIQSSFAVPTSGAHIPHCYASWPARPEETQDTATIVGAPVACPAGADGGGASGGNASSCGVSNTYRWSDSNTATAFGIDGELSYYDGSGYVV